MAALLVHISVDVLRYDDLTLKCFFNDTAVNYCYASNSLSVSVLVTKNVLVDLTLDSEAVLLNSFVINNR